MHLQYHEYGNIWQDVRSARGLRAKVGYVFGPPGWAPTRDVLDPSDDRPARESDRQSV